MAELLFSSLLAIGWLVPDHFPPWPAFHNEAPAFLALCVAWVTTIWEKPQQRLRLGTGWWLSLVLASTALFQYAIGRLPFYGDLLLVCLYVFGLGLAWELGRHWAAGPQGNRHTSLDTLALAFAAAATLSAVMALVQWTEQEAHWLPWVMSAAHTNRAVANLAQPNQLSTLLLMGVIATTWLYERRKITGWLTLLLVCMQTSGVILAQSRTAFVVVAILAGSSPWILRHAGRLRWPIVWAWCLAFAAGTVAFHTMETVHKPAMGSDALQIGLRPLLWQQFGAALAESPWLGYGWLQTPLAQQTGAIMVPGLEQATYAHNQVLDLAIWLGVPATVLLLGSGGIWIWRRRHGLADSRVRWTALWLLPVAVHAMLEFPLAYAYFLFPVAVIVGMIDQWTEPPRPTQSGRSNLVIVPVLTIYAVTVGSVFFDYVRAEEDFRVARFENRNIGQTPAEYLAPDLLLLDQLGTVLKAMRLRATPGMTQEELTMLERASARYSWAALHFRYALALGLNHQPERSSAQLRLIKHLYGEKIYSEAREDFIRLAGEKYPELRGVSIP